MLVQRQRGDQHNEQQSERDFQHGGLPYHHYTTQTAPPITRLALSFFARQKRDAITAKIDAIRGLTTK